MSTSEHPVRFAGRVAFAAIVSATAGAAGACGGGLPASAGSAPVLTVFTGVWPYAEAARTIGGAKVDVVDPVAAGSDPFSYRPDAPAIGTISGAGLVLLAPDHLQPALEAAAAGAHAVTVGSGPGYPWLAPATMGTAVADIARAMESADPQAAPLFRQNAEALQAEISSTGIDFSSALSTCPTHLLVTPDGAFASTARSYDLTQVILAGPASAARIADVAAQVRESGRAGVLSQPWVDDSGLATLASSTGDRVHAVDTLVDPPAPGPSAPKDYRQAMEKLLQELASALGCSTDQ